MTANVDHRDVAAYALGVLGDWESERFEMHLAECDQCAQELEQLTMVSTLLSHVDADSLVAAEQSTQDSQALDRMLNVVSFERRRARTRRVFAVAAGVVVLAVGIAGGVAGGAAMQGKQQAPIAGPTITNTPTPGPSASSSDGGNIGINGEQFESTNSANDVNVKVGLEPKLWGTQVAMELANVRGPLKCSLVAVSKSGQNDTAATWTVSPDGYGTPEQPETLKLDGGTAVQRADLSYFEVRTSDGATLVRVPVA
jgi:hypothetical protein